MAADLAYNLHDATKDDTSARPSEAIYETFRLHAINISGAAAHPTKLV